jgi:hypothetical protein
MLFRRLSGQQRPDPSHLVECISSATAIIAIFDLFCRTIFLLQIQASSYQDDQTLRRLQFCIQALERVKTFNPGSYPLFRLIPFH